MIVAVLAKCIQDLVRAVNEETDPNTGHVDLFYAARGPLLAISTALDDYYIDLDEVAASRKCITAVMEFQDRWELWLETAKFDHWSSKIFHERLLRFSKGAVKRWRIWVIDGQKQ